MSGSEHVLSAAAIALLAASRRATLSTIDARDGRPRSVPICFVAIGRALYSPLDDKPKASADPRTLRRVRNLLVDPRATILVDHWDEDWSRLGYVELDCRGDLIEAGSAEHDAAVQALRDKYPQYRNHRLEARPILRFSVAGAVEWLASTAPIRPEPPGA